MLLSCRMRRRLLRAETKSIAAPVSPCAPCPRVPGCISALLLACPRWRHRSLPLGTQPGGQCWVVGRGLRSSTSRIMAHLRCTRQGGRELLIPVSGPCLRARRTWGPGCQLSQPEWEGLGRGVPGSLGCGGRGTGVVSGKERVAGRGGWGWWWEGSQASPRVGSLKLEGSSRSPSCSPLGINVGACCPVGQLREHRRAPRTVGKHWFRQRRDVSLPQDVSGPLTSSCPVVPPKGAVERGLCCPPTASWRARPLGACLEVRPQSRTQLTVLCFQLLERGR